MICCFGLFPSEDFVRSFGLEFGECHVCVLRGLVGGEEVVGRSRVVYIQTRSTRHLTPGQQPAISGNTVLKIARN